MFKSKPYRFLRNKNGVTIGIRKYVAKYDRSETIIRLENGCLIPRKTFYKSSISSRINGDKGMLYVLRNCKEIRKTKIV